MRYLFVVLVAVSLPLDAQTCQITLQDLKQNPGAPPTEVAINEAPPHCGFLQFAWQAFFAMNWPAIWSFDREDTTKQTRGLPDTSQIIGQGAPSDPTVWELYQPNWYVFSPRNPPPSGVAGWNQDADLPSACGQLERAAAAAPGMSPAMRSTFKSLSSLSKFDPMPGVGQAFSAPLIDQSGYYARYEIRMNRRALDFIVGNQFYLVSAQQTWTQQGKIFNFPVQSGNQPGAIFLKAAWKTLSDAERQGGRFHTAVAFLFTPASPSVQSTCTGPVTVGLVGLHIVQKTAHFPGWIWATFEQVDNTPADPSNPGPQTDWSFFKPGSTKKNTQPMCPTSPSPPCNDWQPTSSHRNDKTGGPTQTLRANLIPNSPNQPALGEINQAAQGLLRQINPNSVWQFYQLVEAQWQVGENPPKFFPPTNVANMTMETYRQSSSCMACHLGLAKSADGKPSDLTFELGLAWKPQILPEAGLASTQPSPHKNK